MKLGWPSLLKGGKAAGANELCFVVGGDHRLFRKGPHTTGAFLVNSQELASYEVGERNTGRYFINKKNRKGEDVSIPKGTCFLSYEQSGAPFDFDKNDWPNEAASNYEEMIITNALHEGMGISVKNIDEEEKASRYFPILFALAAILFFLCIAAAIQAGVFS